MTLATPDVIERLAATPETFPGALLLTGSSDAALEQETRRLAARLLCPGDDPDLRCGSCRRVFSGLHPDFLWQDWKAALAGSGVEDCRWTPCYDCGVCTGYGLEHVVASPIVPAGGSQGTAQDLASGGAIPVKLLPRREAVPA